MVFEAGTAPAQSITPIGTITAIAGSSIPGYSGDGGPAVSAQFNTPSGVAVAKNGNIYVADRNNNRIRVITPDGKINTLAGDGSPYGYSGDNGPAVSAKLYCPTDVVVDTAGNVYIADTFNGVVRKVTTDGIIHTVAGTVVSGSPLGDGGPATSANLWRPEALAMDSAGNLYIADYYHNRVRKVTPAGIISTVAGNGAAGYSGDGGLAVNAALNSPNGLALDAAGNLYISDSLNRAIRKVTKDGVINTYAGHGGKSGDRDYIPITDAELYQQTRLFFDPAGNLYISDTWLHRVHKVRPNGIVVPVADAYIPEGMAMDAAGNLYIADAGSGGLILKVQATGLTVDVGKSSATFPLVLDLKDYTGTLSGAKVLSQGNLAGEFTSPSGSTCYRDTNKCLINVVFTPKTPGVHNGAVVLYDNSTPPKPVPIPPIRLSATGRAPSVAFGPGSITTGFLAQPGSPSAVAFDGSGNMFIADTYNNSVRKMTPQGVVTTIAGGGPAGYSGDEIPANLAKLNGPQGLAIDSSGNVYIADTGNNEVRMIDATGYIKYVAGFMENLNAPTGLSFDTAGNLYIADTGNARISMMSTGKDFHTIAGTSTRGYSGDGGPAVKAEVDPQGIAVDGARNIYIADTGNNRIRKIDGLGGNITTIAGDGSAGFSGDGGPATKAELNAPRGIALDAAGNIYVGDSKNGRIRKISPAGIITTVAVGSTLKTPQGLAVDPQGNVYFADPTANRIGVLKMSDAPSLTFSSTAVGSTTGAQTVKVQNLGNATLNISQISVASNFKQMTGGCAAGQGLAAGASCDLAIAFAPVAAGTITGTALLTDNNLNASGAKQTIALHGSTPSSTQVPTLSANSGNYPAAFSLAIKNSDPKAVIYYTLDYTGNGITPTTSSPKYVGPITISTTVTVEAIAIAPGYSPSTVVTATYTFNKSLAPPNISVPTGTYNSVQIVTITGAVGTAAIYYTVDGSTPTTTSAKYAGAITISSSKTLKAFAVAPGYTNSSLVSAVYTIVGSPSALAAPATGIGTTKATLNAIVNGNGVAGSYVFHYGKASNTLTSSTTAVTLPPSTSPVNAASSLTTLTAKTKYYYQVVVTTGGGTASGAVLSFTTN